MTTALDTSVLLDVFIPDPKFAGTSQFAIERCDLAGSLVILEAVYAELAAHFPSKEQLDHALSESDIAVIGSGLDALFAAGRAWKAYRAAGGKRDRIATDFVIGRPRPQASRPPANPRSRILPPAFPRPRRHHAG